MLRASIRALSTFVLPPQCRRCAFCSIQGRVLPYQIKSSYSRKLSTQHSLHASAPSTKPKSHDRGPPSPEDTQTDFGSLNVLGNTPAPSTSIDACLWDGFHLNSGLKIVGGSGVLLVAGEAFAWRPWEARAQEGKVKIVNEKGQFEVEDEAWGLLGLVWPKPGL
jgi:NADH dehydrogenase [ubiquinone] 1 alpha subcomplex assembly factor 3